MSTSGVVQRFLVEGYGLPGSNMEARSAYQFNRGLIAAAFAAWARTQHFETLIDIGSSTGFLTRKLKPFATHVVAVDADPRVLAHIEDDDIRTIEDQLPELKHIEDQSADIVVSTDTLYYLEDADAVRAIERISEVLRSGGYLVLNDNLMARRLAGKLERWFHLVERIDSSTSLKSWPNVDYVYWLIENRYLTCLGVFNALKDPSFDPDVQLSEIKNRGLVKLCLQHRWLRFALPLTWPLRRLARLVWSSNWLLRTFCVQDVPSPCLSVFRRHVAGEVPASHLC